MQLGVNEILNYLLKYYSVHQYQDLAIKMGVEKTTLSGWKSRGAMGPLLAHLAENDPAALSAIFTSQNNHFGNVTGTGVHNGDGDTTVNNGSKIDLSGLDESMLVLFRDVYLKLEKSGELKKLHDLLGQLKWE